MKVPSADFFPKPARFVIPAVLCSFLSLELQAQTYPPGAVQAPVYRQSGSAYTPAGPRSPAQAPAYPPGYQHGFGTATASTPPKPSSSASKKTGSQTLESKVARLERNDARQDQRLSSLERGHGGTGTPSHPSVAPGGGHYTVRPGDTLWGIASRHNTSINALKAANRLNGETIAIGQSLVIPGHSSPSPAPSTPASQAGVHIVRPGDTFSQIALANGITQDALAKANPSAYPDRLLVGEKLSIPGRSTSPGIATRSPSSTNEAPTASSRAHVVKPGESLGAIAKSYGIATADLAAMNKLKNPNLIAPGQRLIVPGHPSSAPRLSAPVYPGSESPASAAPPGATGLADYTPAAPALNKPTVPPQEVHSAAPPPSKSTVPASNAVSNNRRAVVAYRLERGDDITTVANLFNTSPETIRELNKLPAERKLKEGDEVVVPSLGAVSLN